MTSLETDLRPMRTVISTLRRKLGDAAGNPAYIFTQPCVGFRKARADEPEEPCPG